MKIGVIGDSHIAAFKLAWDELASAYPEVTLVFFGSAGQDMKEKVAIENDRLAAVTEDAKNDFYQTSGGLTEVNFADFDVVLMIGMDCRMLPLYRALKSHRAYDAPASIKAANATAYRTISSGCITRICIEQMQEASMFRILSLIRSVSRIPVFIIPCPLPSIACTHDASARWAFLTRNACETVQQAYYQGLHALCRLFSATLITQPDDTVADFLFTREQLSVGSVRLDDHLLTTPHKEDDYVHMNRDYGKAVLTLALRRIGQA